MTDRIPAPVIPRLHLSLRETKAALDEMHALAAALAEALDAEVDLRHGARTDHTAVAMHTGDVLHEARRRGLLS